MKKSILISFVLLSICSTMESAESPNKRIRKLSLKAQEAFAGQQIRAFEKKNKKKKRKQLSGDQLDVASFASDRDEQEASDSEIDLAQFLPDHQKDKAMSPSADQLLSVEFDFHVAPQVPQQQPHQTVVAIAQFICPYCFPSVDFEREDEYRKHVFGHTLANIQ
ncbi:MAG: hypothetical protein ACJAZS_000282 [Alteromonas naphthalenivorans]|jgi:hypothetical protein